MAYRIQCLKCDTDTWVGDIATLLDAHTDRAGRFVCGQCQQTETYIQTITGRWEREPHSPWEGCLKGAIGIAGEPPLTLYVLLCADAPTAEPTEVRLSYYRLTAAGHPVNGPGPGTAPVLTHDDFRQLLVRLGVQGFFRAQELEAVARLIRLDEQVTIPA